MKPASRDATQGSPFTGPGWARGGQVACAIAIVLYIVVLLRTAWVSDDAYITLRTVDNFVHGHGLRWNVAERVQAFTHPLWLFLITPFYFVTREPFYTTLAVSMLVSVAAVLTLALRRGSNPWAGTVIVTALVFSKCFVDYSTSGLENPLLFLLLAWFVVLLPDDAPNDRTLFILTLLAGLCMLARTDIVLLLAPALAVAFLRHGRWRRGLALAALGLLPLIVWHVFSILYYGIPYPNTALAKLNTGIPAGELTAQGWRYLVNSLRVDPLSLALVACGVATAFLGRRARRLPLATGILLYLAYIVGIGGDFMSGRFIAAPFLVSVALLGELAWSALGLWTLLALTVIAALGFIAPLPTVLCGSGYGMRMSDAIDSSGIADERRCYFGLSGLFGGQPGWSRPLAEATRPGREMRRINLPLAVAPAIGFEGYSAGPGVHIVDYHALADPLLSRLPAVMHDPISETFLQLFVGHPRSLPWRPGHFVRNVPRGYLRTLATGVNTIDDPAIARLYDTTSRLTRGPIWDGQRLATIARLLLHRGSDPALIPRPDFQSVDWDELIRAQPRNAEALYERGNLRLRAGDTPGALESFREACRVEPNQGRALISAADLLGKMGRYEEAFPLLDRAIKVDPGDANVWRSRAWLLDGLQRYEEAAEALIKSAALMPRNSPELFTDVGLEYSKKGDNALALTWLMRADDLDPENPRTSLLLGKVLWELGGKEAGVAALRRALTLDPSLERAALWLSAMLTTSGDRAGALRVLDDFSRDNPPSGEILFKQGELLALQGQQELAAKRWDAASSLGHEGARAALLRLAH